MHAAAAKTFFLDAHPPWPGQRLCIYHAPAGTAKAVVVYVQPWLEEMNKSRRMAALQCRQLAQAGCAVLQIDLLGCGDSSGDLADASWAAWVADIHQAAAWLIQRHDASLWLWGLRSGCLLAAAAGRKLATPCQWLMWQPVTQGRQLVQQLLRLKAAGEMQSGQGQAAADRARQQLAAGQPLEVAGYSMPAALVHSLEQATLEPPAQVGHLVWLELSTREDAALLPTSAAALAAWRAAGAQVHEQVVQGPAFWQTTEIETAPALLAASLAALHDRAMA